MTNYWSDKTVVVTGGGGFIGSHVVNRLAEIGAEVVSLQRQATESSNSTSHRVVNIDLLDDANVRSFFRYFGRPIDAIIHCAALDGNAQFKVRRAAEILDANLRMTSTILNCALSASIERVGLMSSSEVYSTTLSGTISEEDDYREHMTFTENGYVLAKTFGEIMADSYRRQYNMNVFAARPTNVYGPGDFFDPENARVIPAMMHKMATGADIEIWGDGSQERSFIYVEDLVNAVLQMVEFGTHPVMNLATEESISILEIAHNIANAFDGKDRVRLDPSKPTGAQTRKLDVSKMNSTIDFKPRAFSDGIVDTITWYKKLVADQGVVDLRESLTKSQ